MISLSLTGRNILIVEDEWLIAQHLSVILEKMGCTTVASVTTVSEALKTINSTPIDCAFLDAKLNGESSAPVADMLLSKSIPFIIATGYGNLKLPTTAMNAAPRLAKPFEQESVEHILSLVLV